MKARALALLMMLLLLGACSPSGPDGESTPTATLPGPRAATATPFEPEPTSTEARVTETPLVPTATVPVGGYGPTDFPPGINPLTGLQVEDSALLDRRPLAVKITLMPRYSRPQWGLSFADHVYEFYQNGGISRFHAVFLGNDADQVGPVRSARFPDGPLIRMYRSIFAFGSADARVISRFGASDFSPYLVNEYPAACGPMCRVDPNGYNHLVTNTADLSQYISDQGLSNSAQNLDGLRFDSQPPAGGEVANQIYARFGPQVYHRWDYDAASRRYLRFQDTRDDLGVGEDYAPLTDQLTDDQIAADNVVVLLVPHEYFSRDPEIIEINMAGSGTAFAFREGRQYEIRWSVPNPSALFNLSLADGSPYALKPGNTWFVIIGTSSQQTQPAANAWRFDFRIP